MNEFNNSVKSILKCEPAWIVYINKYKSNSGPEPVCTYFMQKTDTTSLFFLGSHEFRGIFTLI